MAAIAGKGEQITSLDSPVSLGSTLNPTVPPGNAQKAWVQNTGNGNVRFYVDGRTPSAVNGKILYPGATWVVGKSELTTASFIKEANTPVLEVTYFDQLDDLTELDQR